MIQLNSEQFFKMYSSKSRSFFNKLSINLNAKMKLNYSIYKLFMEVQQHVFILSSC